MLVGTKTKEFIVNTSLINSFAFIVNDH